MCSIAANRKILSRQDGAALVVTLMMLLGLASLALMISVIASSDLNISGNDRQYQAALDVADAGVAEAMQRLSLRPGTMVNVGGSAVDASIRDLSVPKDVNWQARIFLTAPDAAPSSGLPTILHTGTIQAPGSYLRYSDPADPTAALTIQHRLRDFNSDGIDEIVFYDPSRIPSENPSTGQPVERITVTGRVGSARRTVQADVIRFPLKANVLAALSTDGYVDLRGTPSVCGHDHLITTPTGTQLPDCSPAYDEPDGHLNAVMTTGDNVETAGTTDLLGSPTATNIDVDNPFLSLQQTLGLGDDDLQTILDGADHFGIDANPLEGVTYVDGDALLDDITGSGLLYVTGDAQLRGTTNWRGLIYVEGNCYMTGDVWILGGMVIRGSGGPALDLGGGTPAVLFSRAMLLQALTTSMRYVVLNWKEI